MEKSKTKYLIAAKACLINGERLLEDALFLENAVPPATPYFLSIIAQEEFAKGFLLYLVVDDVIKWKPLLLRVCRNHKCKHLLGVVMDFLSPDTDEFIERINASVLHHKPFEIPLHVTDSINILFNEKIKKWLSSNWSWDKEPIYDQKAEKIATGEIDRKKQDSLYINLRRDGSVIKTPAITVKMFENEYQKANRFSTLLKTKLGKGDNSTIDYEKVTYFIKIIFAQLHNK